MVGNTNPLAGIAAIQFVSISMAESMAAVTRASKSITGIPPI